MGEVCTQTTPHFAFLSVTKCISKCDQLYIPTCDQLHLATMQLYESQGHTPPTTMQLYKSQGHTPPTENMLCKISSLAHTKVIGD